jgi:hypothetical protein
MGALDEQGLDLYVGHLDASEDALAWEVLVTTADAHEAPADIWDRLVAAAQAMELGSEDEIYGPTARLAMQHRSR